MRTLTRYQLLYGVDKPQTETYELRAGPVTALLDGIDLRYVKLGSLEMVRRIYVAVRDQNWNTIPGTYHMHKVEQGEDSFTVEFEVEHHALAIAFAWHGRIVGMSDGHIRYELDGTALNDFRYNRIGLCILHPFRECAGRPYVAQTAQGQVSGLLPDLIGQQRFAHGYYVPLFPAFTHLSIDLSENVQVQCAFEGDLFEMEDQRNWTDASLKTYCTPLSHGFPHQAVAGTHIAQSFTLSADGALMEEREQRRAAAVRLTLGQLTGRYLPSIGFGMNSDRMQLTAREIALLRELRPDHLRVDVHIAAADFSALELAIEACQAVECDLEVAVFFTEETASGLGNLAALLQSNAHVIRFLVFEEGARTAHSSETTSSRLVELARQHLRQVAPQALFAGGTDMYFCELNRTRPQIEAMEAVSFTIIPQAHAFDERSLAETLEAQGETVRSARAFCADRAIIVSPITLKRRYNPHALVVEAERASGELPDAVDPRQMSLFGAVWTAGSVKYLAESGALSLTYFETTGWQGLLERETGSPLPELFPSEPGMLFPLYHVFAAIASMKTGTIVECVSSCPLAATALAVEQKGVLHLLVANLHNTPQRIVIGPLPGEQVSLHRLDVNTAQKAMFEPEAFRKHWELTPLQDGNLTLEMEPYATVFISTSLP
jgi:hypothetical protein